jgi:hypothetical protein
MLAVGNASLLNATVDEHRQGSIRLRAVRASDVNRCHQVTLSNQ